jgi:hypothetical protein
MAELKVFESPGEEWDAFASRYTDLIFYQAAWAEVLKKGLGCRPLYFCLREGGETLAGLPAVLFDFRVFRVLYASVQYGGPIGEPSSFPDFSELLEREFRRRGIDQVRVLDSPFSEPYAFPGYRTVPSKCTLVDLRSFDPGRVREGYRSEVRRAVRKGEKSGLAIRKAAAAEEAEAFHRLYLASMARNRAAARYPLSWFLALFHLLVGKGKADFYLALREGEPGAGVVAVRSPSAVHYLHNGSLETFLEDRPNDLLVDRIIRESVEEGRRVLDFMGSDPEDAALLRFKEKWGGRSVTVHTRIRDRHPLRCRFWEAGKRWAGAAAGKALLRRFGRRV